MNCNQYPKLKTREVYIYVLENENGNIKVGRTTNFNNRLQNLSGSNTGGEKITRFYCFPPTYLLTMECVIHSYFDKYRAEGEWFKGVTFEEVYDYILSLFSAKNYNTLNNLRKQYPYHTKQKYMEDMAA